MTALQTILGPTDTALQDFELALHAEGASPTRAGALILDSPHDPSQSTTKESVEYWRRIGAVLISGGRTPEPSLSVNIMDSWHQPRSVLIIRRLLPKQAPSPVTSAEPPATADLLAALHDLDGAVQEAQEEGFPQPSHQALKNARRLLQDLYRLHRCRLETYPTPDGEVALVVPGGHRRSVLVLCDSDGGALCSVNLSGRHRRTRYSSAAMLPDGFLQEALDELDEPSES